MGILLSSVFSYTQAAEIGTGSCTTCNGTPAKLLQINSMTRELLSTIQTVGTKEPYLGKPVSPVRFEDGTFNPPPTRTISKILRRAREGVGSILGVERVFIENDVWLSILESENSSEITKKGKIYKRDREKMEAVKEEVSNKKYALSVGGWRNSAVKSKTLQKMQKIIQSYIDKGLLDKHSKIVEGVTYSQVVKVLTNINTIAKNQMVFPESNKLKETISMGGISILVADEAVNTITEAYKCVSENKCDNPKAQIKIDIKSIWAIAKSWATNSRQEMVESSERLAAVIKNIAKPIKKNTTSPENQALKNRFGLSSNQIEKAGFLWFKSSKRRSQRQTAKEGFTNMFNEFGKEVKELVVPKADTSNQNNENIKQEIAFKVTMLTTANDILQDAAQQKSYVMMSDNKEVLTWFWDLSLKITEINNIVGERTSENGLIKNLWEICKNQCSNITSKKCYY